MASHSNPTLGFSLVQELGNNEIIKRNRVSLVNPGGRRQEIIIPENSFNLKIEHLEPWKPFCSLRNSNHFVEFDSTMMNPRLLDVHETGQEEVIDFLLSARWRKLSRLVPQFQRTIRAFESESDVA